MDLKLRMVGLSAKKPYEVDLLKLLFTPPCPLISKLCFFQ